MMKWDKMLCHHAVSLELDEAESHKQSIRMMPKGFNYRKVQD